MDVKAYIESGILEAYVLDALTPEEKAGVAADIAAYPELAAEVKDIEEGLFAFAQAGAVVPPPEMKEQIWDAIVKQQSGVNVNTDGQAIDRGNVRP